MNNDFEKLNSILNGSTSPKDAEHIGGKSRTSNTGDTKYIWFLRAELESTNGKLNVLNYFRDIECEPYSPIKLTSWNTEKAQYEFLYNTDDFHLLYDNQNSTSRKPIFVLHLKKGTYEHKSKNSDISTSVENFICETTIKKGHVLNLKDVVNQIATHWRLRNEYDTSKKYGGVSKVQKLFIEHGTKDDISKIDDFDTGIYDDIEIRFCQKCLSNLASRSLNYFYHADGSEITDPNHKKVYSKRNGSVKFLGSIGSFKGTNIDKPTELTEEDFFSGNSLLVPLMPDIYRNFVKSTHDNFLRLKKLMGFFRSVDLTHRILDQLFFKYDNLGENALCVDYVSFRLDKKEKEWEMLALTLIENVSEKTNNTIKKGTTVYYYIEKDDSDPYVTRMRNNVDHVLINVHNELMEGAINFKKGNGENIQEFVERFFTYENVMKFMFCNDDSDKTKNYLMVNLRGDKLIDFFDGGDYDDFEVTFKIPLKKEGFKTKKAIICGKSVWHLIHTLAPIAMHDAVLFRGYFLNDYDFRKTPKVFKKICGSMSENKEYPVCEQKKNVSKILMGKHRNSKNVDYHKGRQIRRIDRKQTETIEEMPVGDGVPKFTPIGNPVKEDCDNIGKVQTFKSKKPVATEASQFIQDLDVELLKTDNKEEKMSEEKSFEEMLLEVFHISKKHGYNIKINTSVKNTCSITIGKSIDSDKEDVVERLIEEGDDMISLIKKAIDFVCQRQMTEEEKKSYFSKWIDENPKEFSALFKENMNIKGDELWRKIDYPKVTKSGLIVENQ